MNTKNILCLSVVAFISLAPIGAQPQPATPTLQLCIRHATNRLATVTWGPPQATLQCSAGATGIFTNIPGATQPYQVDTRLAPGRVYRTCLQVAGPTLFMWTDTCQQPGRLVLEWAPRDLRLQETRNYALWNDIPSVPTHGWYYPPTSQEQPPVPGGVQTGMRAYRTAPRALANSESAGPIYSVNIVAWGYATFQVGRTNFFSYPFAHFDRRLNTLLPLPPEAEGTLLWFFDTATQSFGPPNEFSPDLGGWVEPGSFDPAVWPANQSACVISVRSPLPGTTSVTALLFGEVPQGNFQRTLPPGMSLNSPLIPARGGITSTHRLFPNEGDQVFLFNPGTQRYDLYEFFVGWFPAEPVIGSMDAFFYVNNNGPLNWTASFFSGP